MHVILAGMLLLVACSGSVPGQGAKGDKGDTGPAGATGLAGVAGPIGLPGPAGAPGATGATGATGAAGAAGAAGPAGPQGPTTLVSLTTATAFAAGTLTLATPCDGQTGMAFYGATVDVTLSANQQINAAATVNVGGDPLGRSGNLYVNVCYQPQGGALVADADYFGPLAAAQNTMMPVSVTRSFSAGTTAPNLAPGTTYTIGLCACVDSADRTITSWQTDYSWMNVAVFQQ